MNQIIICIAISLFSMAGLAQSVDERIGYCGNNSDLFLLDEAYQDVKYEIQNPLLRTLSEALLAATYNRTEDGIQGIDSCSKVTINFNQMLVEAE